MQFQNQVLSLHSNALPADTLMVARLSGQEQLSGLFRFELDLICSDPELDLEAVLYAPARLGIKVQVKIAGGKVGTSTREVAGVFEEFEQLEEGQGWTKYRAVMVPKLWNTTRSYGSRIFQDMTIEDIVTAVLENDGLDPQLDFEFQLQRQGDEDPETRPIYPKREYVVQYEESDWHFLARWLEHEGIYFYFRNEDGEEKIVFADTESAYATSPFGTTYPYRPEAKGEGADSDKLTEEEVRSFRCKQTRLPTHVAVNDYNWRVPSARLHFTEDVREEGTGRQTEYNDHFKDEAQGKALAKVRKEELSCRARVFHGAGSCRAFRPGTTFALEEHFRQDFNRSYLLVTVQHEAEQMISLESSSITGFKYENTFTAIADDQPWRPERLTDWPAIKGVMNAKVDAEGDGKYAELDEHGRYKLKMPFDEHSDSAGDGKASRWVRMSQPYAGPGAGMHFPLLKGTEVLLTHIDGDPDRPVISGAVPNPETESPATGANSTQNGIRTASGNTMQIDDNEKASGFMMSDAKASLVSDLRRHNHASGSGNHSGQTQGSGTGGVQPPMDLPGSGSGMTTGAGNKSSGWNAEGANAADGVRAAWNTFTRAWESSIGQEEAAAITVAEQRVAIARAAKQAADQNAAQAATNLTTAQDEANAANRRKEQDERALAAAPKGAADANADLIEAARLSALQAAAAARRLEAARQNKAQADARATAAASELTAAVNNLANERSKANAWNTALAEIGNDGRYRGKPGRPLGLSDVAEAGILATEGTNKVDQTGLGKMLTFLKTKSNALRGTTAAFTGGEGTQDFGDPIGEVHNFTGEAFGSRIRNWVGDDIMLRVGDNYTYADVSNVIAIGTGGTGWKEEHGSTDDHDYQYGDSTSYSKQVGNSHSESVHEGNSFSKSYSYGDDETRSTKWSRGLDFSLHGAYRTDNSINLGAHNSNSINLIYAGGLDIYVGLKVDIEITGAGGTKIEIGGAFLYTMKCTPSETELNASHRTELSLAQTITRLQLTEAHLQATNGLVLENHAAINTNKSAIADTQSNVSANRNALNTTMIGLNNAKQVLVDSQLAMSDSQTTAMATRTSVLHNLM